MNKRETALEYIKFDLEHNDFIRRQKGNDIDKFHIEILKELVDKATPKKLIKLEIIELDKIIMPEYTNTIDKYMCDECGLTWFIVDGHTCQNKFCKQCGQAIDWSKDDE